MKTLSLLAVTTIQALAAAQSVSISLNTVTPVTLQANANSQLATQVIPAGPIPANGGILVATPYVPGNNAGSWLRWESGSSSLGATASIQWIGEVDAPAPAFADSSMCDVLVTVTTSAPVVVNLEILRSQVLPLGSTVTANSIDVGNDGLWEGGGSYSLFGPISVGASLQILVRMHASLAANGNLWLTNTIRVLPVNDILVGNLGSSSCNGNQLEVGPSFFGRGIGLRSEPFWSGDFAIAVLGTSIQPVIVSTGLGSCLLLPAVDVLVPLPSQQVVDLALPAAVRPVGFWAQGVVLSSVGGLWTTNTFAVTAY